MKRRALFLLLVAFGVLGLAGPAAAHRSHARVVCRHGLIARRVHVRERQHGRWVRVWKVQCVRPTVQKKPSPVLTPAPPAPAPATIVYKTAVDPAFTQAPANPLAVTYAYSATAIATLGTTVTNLAATGQLPAGVLNFYSATTPGGPEQLYCALNVGGAVIGGNCPISYPSTGTYNVTTEYIPNAASAVTETDAETISPYSTTATLTATPGPCGSGNPPGYTWLQGPYCTYTLATSATDQNGNPVGPKVNLTAPNPYVQSTQLPAGGTCVVYVTSTWIVGDRPAGQPPTDCSNFEIGGSMNNASSYSMTAAYPGANGWAASPSSAPVTLTP